MPQVKTVYCGWIGGQPVHREALEKICRRVGAHDGELAFRDCEVLEENMPILKREWTRYIWGLAPKKMLLSLPGEIEEEAPF